MQTFFRQDLQGLASIIKVVGGKVWDMEDIIYIDILFLVEWLMDVTLLFLTGKVLRKKTAIWKYIIGGAVLSLTHIIYLFCFNGLCGTLAMGITPLFIWKCIFSPKSWKDTAYLVGAWFGTSFFLCGLVQLFLTLSNQSFLLHSAGQNKEMWMPWQILVWTVMCSYILIRLARNWLEIHITKRRQYGNVTVVRNGKTTSFLALIDTGNTLQRNGVGVMIVEAQQLLAIMSKEEGLQIFLQKMDAFEKLEYKSLGNPHGVLYGIFVDECAIVKDDGESKFQNLYVGISQEAFMGGYEGLIPACLFEEE